MTPAPILHQMALVAEYLSLNAHINDAATLADWAKLNALATRCMMELPVSTWRRVFEAIQAPTYQPALDLAFDLRLELYPDDPMDPELTVVHRRKGDSAALTEIAAFLRSQGID